MGGSTTGTGGSTMTGGGEKVKIKVWREKVREVTYSVKRKAALGKLMLNYCEHTGLDYKEARFTYLSKQIKDYDTPDSLDMELEEDSIDCWPTLILAGTSTATAAL